MTAQEILEKLPGIFEDISEFAYSGSLTEDESSAEIGEIQEVEQHGGEGKGSEWYSVKYFPKHDVYIKVEGYYSSYHGTDFEDGWGHEVRPAQKTITVYNSI